MKKIILGIVLAVISMTGVAATSQNKPAHKEWDPIYITNNSGVAVGYMINSDIINAMYFIPAYGSDVYHQKVDDGTLTTIWAGRAISEPDSTWHIDSTWHQCSQTVYTIENIHRIVIDSNFNCTVN